MAEIRFGLIGAGVHGSRYAQHLRGDVAGARLVALCRRDAKRGRAQAAECGAAFFDRFEDLLASGEVDAVCAAVPPDLHPTIAEAAAAAGVALLLEKPMATGLQAARRILRASASSAAPLMVAHTLRFNRVVQEARRRLSDLGPLHLVALNQRFEPSGRGWLDHPGAGGVILNTGIHEFDLLRFLTGLEPCAVRCRTRQVNTRRTEDVFAAVIDLEPGGVLATVDASRAVRGRSGRIEICGEAGQIIADQSLGTMTLLAGREARPVDLPEPVPTVRETLREFVRVVRRQAPNPIPPAEGARAVAVAQACLRSAALGGAAVLVEAVEVPGG